MTRLFGTDGVRGVAGSELTAELAHGLGRAAVTVLAVEAKHRPVFLLGRDPRESGVWLEDAMVSGIHEAGGDVLLAGVEPTPAVAFLTIDTGADAGVVISASHNPPEYNGIKFFGRERDEAARRRRRQDRSRPPRSRAGRLSARARSGSSEEAANGTWRISSKRPAPVSTG